ncbi:MAG: hypothetical protein FWB96_10680 [Defluviitaleaceae bacterium]|nr:hypothetical protein [Defluviitaleaceae bacterium]MCL2263353.1 hypothetical protein [Defluviitaleaceae bacterium]
MNIKQREQFNLVICILFAVLFVLFGGLGLLLFSSDVGMFENLPPIVGAVLAVFLYGLWAAWSFTGLVGGVWLGCRFLSQRGTLWIILACVFFMFTMQIFWLVGFFVTIPFVIYNFVKIKRRDDGAEAETTRKNTKFFRAVCLAAAGALFAVAVFLITYAVNFQIAAGRFFPTFEDALAEARYNIGELGEIIFTDEHANSVTLLSVNDGFFRATHFQTEKRDGERYYRFFGEGGWIPLQNHSSAQFFLYSQLNEDGFHGRFNRNFREDFGRRPFFGTYRHEVIRNLSINGIAVEYVFEFTNQRGERYFAWYFPDLPPFDGVQEEIQIRFD